HLLDQAERRVRSASIAELGFGKWPIVLAFAASYSAAAIKSLDADIDTVLARTPSKARDGVANFLSAKGKRARSLWYSGLFDVWTKATAIRKQLSIGIDRDLPNGRNADIWLIVAGRQMCVECTALTEDDESCEVWDRFMQEKMGGYEGVLRRPGPFCPPGAKGPSPYYNALRVYAKVYDKLASTRLDPEQSQFASCTPSALLVSLSGPGVDPNAHGIDWALDELFMVQPRWQPGPTSGTARAASITLPSWLDFTAERLIASRRLKRADYDANRDRLLQAPRTIGGVLLFKDCELVAARMNYNALPEHRLTHAEMAKLETAFRRSTSYGSCPARSRKFLRRLQEAFDTGA
ncbi:MAG: hypothetical protein ACREHD_11325, partial [Pirellulales bacterium]